VEWAGKELGVKEMSDWYKVAHTVNKKNFPLLIVKDLINLGGAGLVHSYNHSLPQILFTIFPEIAWNAEKFEKSPQNYWDSVENQKNFVESAAIKLNVKIMSDWYNVTVKVGIWSIWGNVEGFDRYWWECVTWKV
jgi:hypothetical protein